MKDHLVNIHANCKASCVRLQQQEGPPLRGVQRCCRVAGLQG